mgnify:CR=1 FL=1|tara:strand:+ start:654 stop:1640 length:987 start_codon:yes stop_codon:yes gene_type:complete
MEKAFSPRGDISPEQFSIWILLNFIVFRKAEYFRTQSIKTKRMTTRDVIVSQVIKSGNCRMFDLGTPENIGNLRKFHNWIKLSLIKTSCDFLNAENLLDIGVGRGGDIQKWAKTTLKNVMGIDSDEKSINESILFDGAVTRYNNLKGKMNLPHCRFEEISAIDPRSFELLNDKDKCTIYDIVSCQFSFHYFVKDIDIVLNLVSSKLKSGGLFIGTASDGDLIKLNLKEGDISTPLLEIVKKSDDEYTYVLKSGNTTREQNRTYFEVNGASNEYFLHKEYFISKCSQYNLELINTFNFHEWKKRYQGKELSSQEAMASFLNFSFVFKKI